MKFMYPAVFRKNEDGTYNGYFPDLECCTSTGDTLDEAIENANEAAYNWITVELDEEEPNLLAALPRKKEGRTVVRPSLRSALIQPWSRALPLRP